MKAVNVLPRGALEATLFGNADRRFIISDRNVG